MKKKETLFDILLKVSELRMDIETAEKRILRLFNVSNSVFDCPVCGSEWDTDKHNSCKCGACIVKH